MIESIEISNIATYNHASAMDLSKINFFYGANGSGKTTISNIISDFRQTPSCHINWKDGRPIRALVYNRDFVSNNFSEPGTMKGIFTLGEESIEIEKEIEEKNAKILSLREDISRRTKILEGDDGKEAQLKNLEAQFQKECWQAKRKHDKKLSEALAKFRGSEKAFKEKVLLEYQTNNSIFYDLEVLEKKSETIFSSSKTKEPTFTKIDLTKINKLSIKNTISNPIIGKEDIEISKLISKLNNSDWVKKGMSFLEESQDTCPFCQQTVTPDLKLSLEDYFDEEFSQKLNELNEFETSYKNEARAIIGQLTKILDAPGSFIDSTLLSSELESIRSKFSENERIIAEKKEKPSNSFELISISDFEDKVNSIIDKANHEAVQHNQLIENLQEEEQQLKSEVWKHIVEADLKAELEHYSSEKGKITKAIRGLTEDINKKKEEETQAVKEVAELEAKTTTIQPTVTAINSILESYGFRGFSLRPSEKGSSYTLVREDGTLAQETLSEGERTFVTFLYFYHLLKGSVTETGINEDKVVVFDDPISSLDSDILFIVSSLIKNLYDEVKSGTSQIKQIFILTHNIYFHKEVTFDPKRTGQSLKHETFWIVKKNENTSFLEKHDSNPIKSSYDLLWSEIRSPNRSNLTIQNTMRRILETYFKILGGISLDGICDKFEGREKVICKSLLSWVNDGSHFSGEDLYVTVDEETVEKQLQIFKEIFKRMDHESHYNMMIQSP